MPTSDWPPLACRRGATWITLAWLLMVSSARAQDDVSPETLLQSNALFADGKRELDAGNVGAGCAAFAESYRLLPRGGTLLNLGLCREREGRLAEAWRVLRAALATAQRDGRDDRIPLAREHIAALEGQLSFAALALPHDVDPSLVALRLDGAAIPREEWNAVPLQPGEHVVSAEAVGFQSWATKLTVGPAPARLMVSVGPLTAVGQREPLPQAMPMYVPAPTYGPAPTYALPPPRVQEAPEARALRLEEQRLAAEGWFLEASLGVTASHLEDEFVQTLHAFDYEESNSNRLNGDLGLGLMLTRNIGLVLHYVRLEKRRYAVMNEYYATEEPGTGDRYVYSWHTQAALIGLRLRQPLASRWVVAFADLTVGLGWTKSALEYEVAAGAGFLSERDNARHRSVAVRGLVGLQFGFTRHFGAFIAGGYAYAPTLRNEIDQAHDAGGGVFLTGLRLNSVKGWW
jgi:hypothetical protein